MSIIHRASDSEKQAYDPEKKIPFGDATATYFDEGEGSVEVVDGGHEFGETKVLKRGLKQRHIQMIALAGAIGTGLFLGSGKAIARGGPLGAFMGYTFVGILVAGVVMSIAELSALLPLSGGIIRHAEPFVDPALSFATGWNSIYSSMVSLPAEIVAAAVIVEFWISINSAIWIAIFGLLLVVTNLCLVKVYGETEFVFSMLKIMLIIGINIMALVITCGGGPAGETYGFRYWRGPGPFVQYLDFPGSLGRFMGFWTTFSNAVYAYAGVETISVAAAETQNPRTNIPIAAKRIFARVTIFYVLTIFMVGMLVPSNDPNLLSGSGTAASSPFVIAAKNAGVKVVPSIINAVVLSSAWSAGNSGLFTSSRTLYGIAREGRAPKIFTRVNRFGIPYVAVGFMSLFICLGFMTLSDSASTVFSWLQDLVSVAAIINWMVICTVYLRFYYGMKAQGISRTELPWKGPLQPYAAWSSLIAFGILLLFGGYTVFLHHHWDTETFVSSYINIPIFALLYFGSKFYMKSKIVSLKDIPIRKFINIANANPEPVPEKKRGWRKLNILWS